MIHEISPWDRPLEIDRQDVNASKAHKNGVWESLGVSTAIAHALLLRNYKQPTPIQRASLSNSLAVPSRDVLGMARTGSGKTLAYIIPLLQRLQRRTANSAGPRALILCPNRELALQILRVGKDLARNLVKGKDPETTRLCWALIIGGEDMDKQFGAMTDKPDVVIATPGRWLHIVIEMSLNLQSIELVIYDEADRLFEMGFDTQLREIVHRLPTSRQSLMFSATLPTNVSDFARAGLTNPLLIRLDSDMKLSPDLKLAFLPVRPYEKDAALLVLIDKARDMNGKPTQTVIFVATKHHVEYILNLLRTAAYRVNHVYGSLDQVARKQQLEGFRVGNADILVVTDVAARGLDMPDLDLVINYDFPPSPRTFLHRVGRTARAGRRGSAWSLLTAEDVPYALDLQRFLAQPILQDMGGTCGRIDVSSLDNKVEYVHDSLVMTCPDLLVLEQVMRRGQKMFARTRNRASEKSYRDAKAFTKVLFGDDAPLHHIFADQSRNVGSARQHLLGLLSDFGSPSAVGSKRTPKNPAGQANSQNRMTENQKPVLRLAKPDAQKDFRDASFFMEEERSGAELERDYSLSENPRTRRSHGGQKSADGEDYNTAGAQRPSQLKESRRLGFSQQHQSVAGAKPTTVRSESGVLVPVSYKSGRYDAWRKSQVNSISTSFDLDQKRGTLINKATHNRASRQSKSTRTLKTSTDILRERELQLRRKAKSQRGPVKSSKQK